LLRKRFFGRFEVAWTWPEGSDPRDSARVEVARAPLVLAQPMGKAANGVWRRDGHAALFRRDRFTPPVLGERIRRGFGEAGEVRMEVLDGVEPTYAFRNAAARYEQVVLPFLKEGLSSCPFSFVCARR